MSEMNPTPPSRDNRDALMDQLLREILGGDRPRDLTVRVLERAQAYDKTRRAWWAGGISAIAASVVLAGTLWALWPVAYPAPHLESGVANITDSSTIERGTRLVTADNQQATLDLGGYVKVNMQPQTALTIGGDKFAEKVILEQGEVAVAVAKKKGKFDVAVGPATVRVTGTKFRVRVQNDSEPERVVKNLVVNVEEGSVLVDGVDKAGPVALAASSGSRAFPLEFSPIRVEKAPVIVSNHSEGSPGAGFSGPGTGKTVSSNGSPIFAPAPADNLKWSPLNRPANKPLLVIFSKERVEHRGLLRKEQGIYLLETEAGRVLLFPQQEPLDAMPEAGKRVVVAWEGGKVVRIGLAPIEIRREQLEKQAKSAAEKTESAATQK